jgi:NAD dependent epimerase/dehydratase family enzyme
MKGAYNAAVADATNNTIFSTTLAKIYGYKLWLPNVPSFLIRLGMGEMAVIILTGRRVSADKIKKTGFEFRYLSLEKALRNCIR